eukprot:CAMPEP_0168739504 /NCGR_PEP_ID=MMETSP0724-20121128/11498_1 /TAXON_ID=265536 /ORGANISM="Amphiprora sp., Strain CCMP467" /LENGTH=103 /DNA_ID=CAMNT_0008786911 /DNA_START=406 /DNA_END=717 /DNA_ORIENTATION=+
MTLNHKYPCDVVSETSRKKIRSTARFIKPPCQEISRPMIQVHRYHAVTPTDNRKHELPMAEVTNNGQSSVVVKSSSIKSKRQQHPTKMYNNLQKRDLAFSTST